MTWICRMYLSDIPIEHKYFLIKAVQVFLGFRWKRTPFMNETHRGSKITNLQSTYKFFFIEDYIYFTRLFSISNKFEDLQPNLIYHLSLILTKI